jgi:hypothetical protein
MKIKKKIAKLGFLGYNFNENKTQRMWEEYK